MKIGQNPMIIKSKDFDANIIKRIRDQPRPVGNQRTRARRVYKDIVCAFDTETTYIKDMDRSILYIWQFQLDEVCTIYGRTWKDFINFYERINAIMKEDEYIIVYVHNLSYEFQFMRSLFDIIPDDVFVVKSRRILKWTHGHFEFRCSYIQTNLSLNAFTRKFNVAHQKLSGDEFDYKRIRYSDTELTEKELEYCFNDVIGLVEAIKAEMARDNDNLYTIPLTSTGYVRRDIKAGLRLWGTYKISELLPNVTVYELLREAFRGGNTHANRYFVKNPEFPLPPIENVKSADRSSSYPDVQVNYKFPMSPFKRVIKEVSYTELKEHYIKKRGYALIFRMYIKDLKLKDKFNPCPYISYDKARCVRGKILDNGRILSADYLEITITDIDFNIIDKQYMLSDSNVEIHDLYFSRYDYLPDEMREIVKNYYIQKTQLKGIEEQKLYYNKFKNLINACYGCSAQDPAKDNILYMQDGSEDEEGKLDKERIYAEEGKSVADILAEARPTMPYQWGVWTTARARELLQIMIDAVHENAGSEFVYTDTDSVKYIGDFDLEQINQKLRKIAEANGAYANDSDGVRHYMGEYEYEGEYKRFETMGAKSYVYEDQDGKLYITIAGVPKEEGAEELQRMGGFDAYKVGAVFHDGVTETRYHDEREYRQIEIGGHAAELTSDIVIKDSFHQIGFAQDYSILLSTLTQKDIASIRKKR